MHTNQKSCLVLVAPVFAAFVFCLTALPSFAQQSAKGKAAETATLQLLQIHKSYQQAGAAQKQQLLTQFTTLAAQRQQLLSSLIQTNPGDVLRVAIPNNISQKMPSAVQGYVEQSVTTQGVLEVLYEMQGQPDKTTGTVLHHFLQTSTGRLGLHFAASAPTHLLTGSVVRVNGVRVSNDLALASGNSTTSLQTVSAASAPGTSGAVSTLVILVNFQDNSSAQPWTASAVQNMVFTQTSNWDMENSFQHTWLSGDVAGWFTVPVASTNCDTTTIKSKAQSAAQSAGYNLSTYAHYIYLMSSNTGCSAWWGLATIGGGDVWVNGQYGIAVQVFAHEMGHNFGLYHAHNLNCGTTVLCSSGSLGEYGDAFDTMGSAPAGHFNAFQKERLGWLNSSAYPPITTVTTSGTYQIGAYEAQDTNPKSLKIPQSGSSGNYYYVEFRQPQGFDQFVSSYSDVVNGVIVHLAAPSNSNSSDILDMTPTSPATFYDPALVAGQSYQDSTAGITITPVSIGTNASLQVTLAGPACTPANPTVSVSPSQSQYVTSGTAVSFTVTVRDNDSSVCAPATFNLTDVLASGWVGSWNSSALSLSPGSSASATLTVTSPTGAADGFYNVAVSASNSATTSYSGSASSTYVISTPVPMSVTVSTNQSTYSPGQTVAITVSVRSGTSPDSGAGVSVSVTPPGRKATALTATTGSNGIASLIYKLQKRAATGTYQVRANPTVTGTSSTTGASTTFVVQ